MKQLKLTIVIAVFLLFITGCEKNIGDNNIIMPEETIKENEYVKGNVVNRFITDFNLNSSAKITDIKQGNIRTKYFAYINGQYIELLNSNTGKLIITVNGDNTEESLDSIIGIYKEISQVIEKDMDKNKINELIEQYSSGGNYDLTENTHITFSPIKEMSWGKTACKIEIKTIKYN